MNPTQRKIILVGAIVFVLMLLFPPWIGPHTTPAQLLEARQEYREGGRYLNGVWQPLELQGRIDPDLLKDPDAGRLDQDYGYAFITSKESSCLHINLSRLLLQWAAVAVVTSALVVASKAPG